MRAYLEKDGYDVITANEGRKALEMIKTQNPDLVVLDLNLPCIDGWMSAKPFEAGRRCW